LFKRKLTEEKGIPKRDGSRRQKAQSWQRRMPNPKERTQPLADRKQLFATPNSQQQTFSQELSSHPSPSSCNNSCLLYYSFIIQQAFLEMIALLGFKSPSIDFGVKKYPPSAMVQVSFSQLSL